MTDLKSISVGIKSNDISYCVSGPNIKAIAPKTRKLINESKNLGNMLSYAAPWLKQRFIKHIPNM